MREPIRLGLIYGGKSSEHEVSLRTALSIVKAVDHGKYELLPIYIRLDGTWVKGRPVRDVPSSVNELRLTAETGEIEPSLFSLRREVDVVFPVVHGPNGEDGTLQGLLEMIDIPYVGSGVLGSAVGMDKVVMKNVFAQHGLPQVKYMSCLRRDVAERGEELVREIEERLGYPCFVKPANLGSSVGISKVKGREQLLPALQFAARYDRKLIIEAMARGRELEIGVLGNEDPQTSVVGEIIPGNEFYDYEAKYKDVGTKLEIPAPVPESVVRRMREIAVAAFRALDCSGLARVDFFWDEETDRLYLNEINTLPGFTPFSMYPLLWQEAGVSYPELIDRLIQLAIARFEERRANAYEAESLE
ncbi:D-alanine--D-alanine ligase [Bacillaceae bacterium]